MNGRLLIFTFCVLTLAVGTVHGQSGDMLTPPQLIELMNASNVTYLLEGAPADSLEQVAIQNLFVRQRAHTPNPKVAKNGEVSSWSWPGLTQEIAEAAEKDFGSGDMNAARADYRKILATSPDCYLAIANIGDCYLKDGNTDSAIGYYAKSIAINPIDYLPYYYKADALYRAKRFEQSRQAMIDVLTLRPRYAGALRQLRGMPQLGVTVHDSLFAPKGYAEQTAKGILVKFPFDSAHAAWMGYAIGKALWLGEPAHRRSLTGSETMSWSLQHETECLGALIASYETTRGTQAHQPDLEMLEAVTSDGLLSAYILYEIGSRLDEDIMLTVGPNVRDNVRKYVEKFIMPKP